ncbi:hypothetical protein bplSymb_SCF02802P021 [Bathymodiolus platifrons methanotrophic gill symbiont]|uniref:hypothetical protein n=1 Tax=Bathymodiolus platifrons methanotrophic gill symbiont TaxID=113268 RepID=UPI000B4109E4|nr:hypothetical protein [Bathymodiolus platifrons methanotrophic gill symbiont]GAW86481.1 hypothetical protein bplSymb_SCF02802P021 [Bathymodiolus platifrons methanotrophic gill symbiont]GFO76476.1 hypothetical protein BPLS_P4268 [Bathymodiolus platifrons methanotrophic gill symbiont]
MNILKSKKLILVISLITSLIITNSVSANTLQGALDETNQSISEVFCPELLANGQCKYDIGDPDVDNIFKEYYSKLLEDDTLAESYRHLKDYYNYSKGIPQNILAISCPKLLANGQCAYDIGDKGPAGGVVFYVTDDGEHGFEMAPENQFTYTPWVIDKSKLWGCDGVMVPGTGDLGVGKGRSHTQAILDNCEAPEGAILLAQMAHDYTLNGYSDWFIPSLGELLLMRTNLYVDRDYDFESRLLVSSSEDRFYHAENMKSSLAGEGSADDFIDPIEPFRGVWRVKFYFKDRSDIRKITRAASKEWGLSMRVIREF